MAEDQVICAEEEEEEVSRCDVDADCPDGQQCVNGECQPIPGQRCAPECESGQECVNGVCVDIDDRDSDNGEADPPIPKYMGKKKIVYNSDLYFEKPYKDGYYGEGDVNASTPYEHHVGPTPRNGLWELITPLRVNGTRLDRFRHVIGAHYGRQLSGDGTPGPLEYFNRARTGDSFEFFKEPGRESPEHIPISFHEARTLQRLDNNKTRQQFVLTGKTEKFALAQGRGWQYQRDWWVKYIVGGNVSLDGNSINLPSLFETSIRHWDFNFELQVPLFPEEIDRSTTIRNPPLVSLVSDYNFFIKPYEQKLLDLSLNEAVTADFRTRDIPNMYVFEYEKRSQSRDNSNTILNRMITLDGALNREHSSYFRDIIKSDNNLPGTKVAEKDKGDYFYDWANIYTPSLSEGYTDRFKQIVFDSEDMKTIFDINKKKYLFPMYTELMFSTDRDTQISDLLKQAKMTFPVIGGLLAHQPQDVPGQSETDPWTLNYMTEAIQLNGDRGISHQRNNSIRPYDLEEFIDHFKNNFTEIRNVVRSDDSVVLSLDSSRLDILEPNNRLARTIISLIVTGKLAKIIEENGRNFQQIMRGEPAYSETIAYKINKFRRTSSTGRPWVSEQVFYIPNSSDLNIFEYIDTQVAYNHEYKYEVTACQVVAGSEYEYVNPVPVPQTSIRAQFTVDVTTKLKIFEIPYFSAITKVLDSAPLPPDIDVIPYRGISDKMLFFLNSQTGLIREDPITINPEDDQRIADYRASRNLPATGPIDFEGDDEIENFEVFRTTKRPTSYSDFQNMLHENVTTEPVGANFDASSGAFIDTIAPNTRYYYMFRSMDVHGNTSNPSAVYAVEMVVEDGAVFPLIEVYNMVPIETKDSSKTFERFLLVDANSIQSSLLERLNDDSGARNILLQEPYGIGIPEGETANPEQTTIGTAEESLFGSTTQPKKFKLRITSKNTGKKIDINLKFMQKHINKL